MLKMPHPTTARSCASPSATTRCASSLDRHHTVMRRISAEIWFSEEDGCWIAIDRTRPGCSAAGDSEAEALRELQDARIAHDSARAAALAQTGTTTERTQEHREK